MIGRRRIGRVDSILLCTEHRLGTKKHAEHIDGPNMYNEHASKLDVSMSHVFESSEHWSLGVGIRFPASGLLERHQTHSV